MHICQGKRTVEWELSPSSEHETETRKDSPWKVYEFFLGTCLIYFQVRKNELGKKQVTIHVVKITLLLMLFQLAFL
jgi:hypothetical protein